MDGPALEQSDSDSGESWTLLENNSVYADDAPEFIDEQARCEAQHHEKDEDTDGISIISDSDHEAPSPPPPPPDQAIFEKSHLQEHLQPETVIPEYVPVTPYLNNINDDDQEVLVANKDFLGDSHAKHKTYVHRRNKRLSTVLNIIVLGSVITAAGVAIGHMWGAKNDCTMQTTSSVNKILSNLYKLQEENAYLRSKLKELTFVNNKHIQQQKIQPKHNKCRRVFEESLSNNEPRKFTKCVDENYNNVDNFMEHLVKPKFEKEFVADIDKLKTVYLQNKSWLDDEISRRLKIEEELLKKYNNEVNSAKLPKRDLLVQKNNEGLKYSESKDPNEVDDFVKLEIPNKAYLPKKITYADSLQTDEHPRFRRHEKRHARDDDNYWFTSKNNINNLDEIKQHDAFTFNEPSNQNQKPDSGSVHDEDRFTISYNSDSIESTQKDKKNHEAQKTLSDSWTEVKPKIRRNEERYETDYDKSFLETDKKTNSKVQQEPIEKRYTTDDNSWPKHSQEIKYKGKKEKGDSKQREDSWKKYSSYGRILENFENEDIVKDDRYVVNKLKQEKKRKGYINSNKKQKRKSTREKWNMKGEFGERFEAVATPEDYVWNYSDKNENNIDRVSIIKSTDDTERVMETHKNHRAKPDKLTVEKNDKNTDNKEQSADWFEKRAMFRTEARKKYYEQFGGTSPNNSSWYFRRMRKREQCRAKGNNSTFRKFYKEKKTIKMKY